MAKGPVLIELDDPLPSVSDAPDVPSEHPIDGARGHAVQGAAQIMTHKPSRLVTWFLRLAGALIVTLAGIAAWDFAVGLVGRYPVLGWSVTVLMGAVMLMGLALAVREVAALGRLKQIDGVQREVAAARSGNDLGQARAVVARMRRLYATRPETADGRARLTALEKDQLDADALLRLAESTLLTPLDRLAQREIETAARQVAAVTVLVPLAMADVIAALLANVRMIRRIAEVYGGRGGLLGGWRLTRAVMAHLVATGAIAVGDDLLEPVLGGTMLGKLSRRFGEGLVNGALTVRVGVAAMDVCRPMAFAADKRPKLRDIIYASLSGLARTSK